MCCHAKARDPEVSEVSVKVLPYYHQGHFIHTVPTHPHAPYPLYIQAYQYTIMM